ncbi:alpha-L-rhamnosidase [Agromyces mangrovi Wang et al. 2018]|uniref:alpha-L-rhamnosidase n=1 Tax=Agromyces mangrovi TaxID=1858653 RepID=UPI002572CE57|nr:alpha-L-rhamnosidase [Agromyces mangrovi]BDZ64437.1 alpha-L-rhamnosidase [Agromyces mangrovi]
MSTTATVTSLRPEYGGLGRWTPTARPRLSWKTTTAARGWVQNAAQVAVLRDGVEHVHGLHGSDSVLVAWPFAPLAAREQVQVRVRVHGTDGWSDWSDRVELAGAFLPDGEWSAQMIGAPEGPPKQPALLHREFTLSRPVARATLYATARGAYQVSVNGVAVDDQEFKPGWTSYRWRLVHDTTDVTQMLADGPNAIGIELAGAWFTESYVSTTPGRGHFGDHPSVAAQLVIEYADGTAETVATDHAWSCTTRGPLLTSGIYHGEDYDARRDLDDWARPGLDASSPDWTPARVFDDRAPVPVARTGPPVRATAKLPVAEVLTTPAGRVVLDFGQNLVGRVRFRVRGPRGTRITLRHAEVLEHGELGTRPLRGARATDTYTLAGHEGGEVSEPRFTFHGFRYVEVEGWPGDVSPHDFTAVVLGSDMERTGWFESSNPLLDRFHENAVWGMRGNFLSVPMDCPQRDERLGWTGDILAFGPAATFLYECNGFLASWLEDVWIEQAQNGGVPPFVVPSVLELDPAAAWGDVVTVLPTVLRERFADTTLLRRAYPGMRAWCGRILALAGDNHLWEDGFQFGDWLDPDASPDHPGDGKTDPDLVATAFLHLSLRLTADAALECGLDRDADRYREQARAVRSAFLTTFSTARGRLMSDSPAAYAIAIAFGLHADERQRLDFGDRLAHLTRAGGYRIRTGFVGTPLIQDALTDTGHAAAAARLMLQTEHPSWLHPVTLGATTIWERWDSMRDDGSINPGEMTSFNHYALGAVVDWMHRRLAGLAPAEPGYRTLRIAPLVIDGLDHARAAHETPYGRAEAGWTRAGDDVTVTVVVPPNAIAEVLLPDGRSARVGSGTSAWTVRVAGANDESPRLHLDSPLSELIDDSEAYQYVRRVVEAHAPGELDEYVHHTKWTPGRRIRDAFRYAPLDFVDTLGDALRRFRATDDAIRTDIATVESARTTGPVPAMLETS